MGRRLHSAQCGLALWLLTVHGAQALRLFGTGSSKKNKTLQERSHFFYSSHKTGTALINHICDHVLSTVEGRPDKCARCQHIINVSNQGTFCTHAWSDGKTFKQYPELYNLSHHYFVGTPLPDVRKFSKDYRAVYITRDPVRVFASAYIYDQKGADHGAALGGQVLKSMPLTEGLKAKAADTRYLVSIIWKMTEMAQSDPRMLLVRFEDFKTNFNATAGKVFSFMRDGNEEHMDRFLAYARVDDMSTWHPIRSMQLHVSDPKKERQVVDELFRLCDAGDENVKAVLSFRRLLGYGEPCERPVDTSAVSH